MAINRYRFSLIPSGSVKDQYSDADHQALTFQAEGNLTGADRVCEKCGQWQGLRNMEHPLSSKVHNTRTISLFMTFTPDIREEQISKGSHTRTRYITEEIPPVGRPVCKYFPLQ